MSDGVWKGVQPLVIGHFKQLSLNKFFDPSTPSMRKGDDGEKRGKKEKKIKTFLVATNLVASRPSKGDRLQHRPLVPIYDWPLRGANICVGIWILQILCDNFVSNTESFLYDI